LELKATTLPGAEYSRGETYHTGFAITGRSEQDAGSLSRTAPSNLKAISPLGVAHKQFTESGVKLLARTPTQRGS